MFDEEDAPPNASNASTLTVPVTPVKPEPSPSNEPLIEPVIPDVPLLMFPKPLEIAPAFNVPTLVICVCDASTLNEWQYFHHLWHL